MPLHSPKDAIDLSYTTNSEGHSWFNVIHPTVPATVDTQPKLIKGKPRTYAHAHAAQGCDRVRNATRS